MAQREKEKGRDRFKALVQFAGLQAGEAAPTLAVYEVDATGRATRKLARAEGGELEIQPEWEKLAGIALGPDVEDVHALGSESLVPYRMETIAPVWRDRGLVLSKTIWERFFFETVCITGRARKCRQWWWDRIERLDLVAGLQLSRAIPLATLAQRPEFNTILPSFCLPLCDGIVEIHERVCCCRRIKIPDLLDGLRELLKVIPIPIPEIGPGPGPEPPGPGPDPTAFRAMELAAMAAAGAQSRTLTASGEESRGILAQTAALRSRLGEPMVEVSRAPSERIYEDYVKLSQLSQQQAQEYVLAHPYLIAPICSCSQRKVGEIPLQPGGRFDFCYTTIRGLVLLGWYCRRLFAFRVRQRIQGAWVTVYDGLAAKDWFSEGTLADIRTSDWRSLVCGSGPGDPPPSDDALPFAMLEYIGSPGTRHFNFPAQTQVSRVGALAASSGTYTTSYAPDCPWGGSLGLRLWVHHKIEPIAKYYRLSVVPVDSAGVPSGAVSILSSSVSWDRFVSVGPDWVIATETLSENPAVVDGQVGLIRIPYWSDGKFWLTGQYHQVWNSELFAAGRYLLLLELFNASGKRIKPNSAPAPEPGDPAEFQFRRWQYENTSATDNVPFADAAHVFWVDNTDVRGRIVDIRKGSVPSDAECQFISGPGNTPISIGFRAYHARGVSDPTNTFMWRYSLKWYRGLNGPSGDFAAGTADVGEPPAGPYQSNSQTIDVLLGAAHQRCTFSARLRVYAKHFTGSGRIHQYDADETASFALSKE